MAAKVVSRDGNVLTLQVTMELGSSMLETENLILSSLNEAGVIATRTALEQFDTDGRPINVGGVKMTTKGLENKVYQCPFGPVPLRRHVYQTSKGGPVFCPLERDARIISTSTPKFAKMVASKYSGENARWVVRDLEENHGRKVVVCFVQALADIVGTIASTADQVWSYEVPPLEAPVKTITIGLDGTCMLMVKDGWRQAMVGTIGLYDRKGNRLHTTYLGAAPELGREVFLERLERETLAIKARFPRALTIGLADGAPSNWDFLAKHTELQVLDFYHASEYLTKVADVVFAKDEDAREDWLSKVCHRLKHESTGPNSVIKEMTALKNKTRLPEEGMKTVQGAIDYFRNNECIPFFTAS